MSRCDINHGGFSIYVVILKANADHLPDDGKWSFCLFKKGADENGLYPIRLYQSFDLSNLPSEGEFLEICEPEQDEPDEEETPVLNGLTGM